jgi:hypothetical protein
VKSFIKTGSMSKKIVLAAFLLFETFQLVAQVPFTIKVPRLYVSVKRVITRKATPYPCPTNNCYFVSTMGYNTLSSSNNNRYDKRYNDFSTINSMNIGDSLVYSDTLDIINYNMSVTRVFTDFFSGVPIYDRGVPTFPEHSSIDFPVNYDNVPYTESAKSNGYFLYKTIVQGIINTDISRTLPSHDSIRIVATPREQVKGNHSLPANANLEYKWYYSVDNATNWQYIPSSDTSSLTFSGEGLFGSHYNNHINKTVFIKSIIYYNNNLLDTSNVEPFTHRLSAPRIISLAPVHVDCWGDTTGSFKVTFNRALRAGERLNLLLKDTINLIDYNVLNVASLASDNSVTWSVELLGGTDYQLGLIGKYLYNSTDGVTYTSSPNHFGNFHINQPERLRMYAVKRNDVLCKAGNSGVTDFSGLGGIREYKVGYRFITDTVYTWATFNNPILIGSNGDSCVYGFGGFKKGIYYYKFRDGRNCLVKENGFEKITSIEFTEPSQALRTDLLDVQPITSAGGSNGKIIVRLAGGTPIITPHPYAFEWKDSATGVPITNFALVNSGGVFETSLSNLGEATYTFNAWDDNYNLALPFNTDGCKVSLNMKLVQPFPLLVDIQLKKQVSCVGSNNAEIIARPTGGVKDNIVGYYYKWYRQNGLGGWDALASTDSALYNVAIGIYQVEVKDKYNNTKTSNPFTITNPPALVVATSTTPSSCFSNADGSATVTASGGTPPYTYEWSNGVRSQTATQLVGGNYLVYVKDTMGCETIFPASVTSPVSLLVSKTITPVVCNSQCNAAIQLNTTGGTGPYTYLWNNGSTSPSLTALCSGQYSVRISDNQNCVLRDTIDIQSPPAFSVSAGPDREICQNHKIRLDATVVGQNLNYIWRNTSGAAIASTPSVNILTAGTYMISGTSSTGCTKLDTCYITAVDSYINTDFVVSAQAYANTNTLMVNLSDPRPVQTQWIVPNLPTVQTINTSTDYCELRFTDTGVYNVTMKVWYASGCIDEKTKKVIVTTKESFAGLGNQANAVLQSFRIFPNPGIGNFNVELQFNAITQARLRLINTLSNVTVSDKKLTGSITYNEQYNLAGTLSAGVYILMIETAKGNFIYKVIIQ